MKSSTTIPCTCGKQIHLEISGSGLPQYVKCPVCGATIYLVEPLGNIVTLLPMARAKQELAQTDATISTLLSAVAVEAEMAYLFFKWKAIDSGKLPDSQTPEDKEQWEDEWSNMRSIGKRLEELSRLLTDRPFDEFAYLKRDLLKTAFSGYKADTSIKDFLQEQVLRQTKRDRPLRENRLSRRGW